ncbi:MAG: preprotein translocase subunit SecE [Candidatus Gastranaerophilales bacterium]|nr:preprotein translocase subunit SecE [Candidatus Gastranaerophilales bacterium]
MEQAKSALKEYFKGVKAEWYKITWPQKNQIVVQTITTVAVVFFFTTIVYLLDIIFKGLFSFIPGR